MKKEYFKTADSYMSPKIYVLRFSIEGLLCVSLGVDNDPFEDGGSVDLFFL